MEDSRRGPDSKLEHLALPAVLVLALALRVIEALRTPLWYDELYSLAAVTRPLPDALRIARADVHPPLYFVLEWVWRHLAPSDFGLRSLSIAFAVVALAASYSLARELFGPRPALLATLLVALHPWHVYVSQEARSYALLWALLAISWRAAWRWIERGHRADAVAWLFATALAMWTHYLAGALAVPVFAFGVIRLRAQRERVAAWVGLHLAVVAFFAPLLPLWWLQLHRPVGEALGRRPGLADLIDVTRRFAFSRAWLAPLVIGLAAWSFREPTQRRAAAFVATVGPLAVLLCWLGGLAGARLFGAKYMMFALPPLFALVAAGVARLPGRGSPAIAAALLVVAAGGSLAISRPQPEAESLARVRAALTGRVREGDRMFHADTHTLLFAQRYFPGARHALVLAGQHLPFYEGDAVVPDSLREDLARVGEARERGERWWAMASRPAGLDPRAAAACFDSLAAAPATSYGVVRVWSAVSPPGGAAATSR